MSRAVKIFGDAAQGSLFFEGSPHPPAPLGGVVVAMPVKSTDRIKITRSDQFQKNGVDPRVLFKRMRITELGIKRIKDLFKILVLLSNRLLIILTTKQIERQTRLTSKKMALLLVAVIH